MTCVRVDLSLLLLLLFLDFRFIYSQTSSFETVTCRRLCSQHLQLRRRPTLLVIIVIIVVLAESILSDKYISVISSCYDIVRAVCPFFFFSLRNIARQSSDDVGIYNIIMHLYRCYYMYIDNRTCSVTLYPDWFIV